MRNSGIFPRLNRDGWLVMAASAVRAFDYGFLSVFLGVYLTLLDFSALEAGFVFSGIMAGGALSNLVASFRGDVIGRRRMLVVMSTLMVVGGALFMVTSSMVFLAVIGLFAMTTATGGDRTAFISLDTAILAQSARASHQTLVFSWYNLLGFLTKAVGALLITLPPLFESMFDVGELTSFKIVFGVYAIVAAGQIFLYSQLSPRVEVSAAQKRDAAKASAESRGIILKMSGLFSLDAMGGGFVVRSFVSFWFVENFGVGLNTVAVIFFGGQILNAVSVSLAAPVASRIGLINTMAFTQALSNVLMIVMALTGNLWLAVALYLLKELANDMDIPTRQTYTMAIVPPEARTAMASVSNLGRNMSQTVSPTIAGVVASTAFLGAPFLIGAGIKLTYNALLYLQFRGAKTPEEARQSAAQSDEIRPQTAGDDD